MQKAGQGTEQGNLATRQTWGRTPPLRGTVGRTGRKAGRDRTGRETTFGLLVGVYIFIHFSHQHYYYSACHSPATFSPASGGLFGVLSYYPNLLPGASLCHLTSSPALPPPYHPHSALPPPSPTPTCVPSPTHAAVLPPCLYTPYTPNCIILLLPFEELPYIYVPVHFCLLLPPHALPSSSLPVIPFLLTIPTAAWTDMVGMVFGTPGISVGTGLQGTILPIYCFGLFQSSSSVCGGR